VNAPAATALDVGVLGRLLAGAGEQVLGPLTARPVGQGQSNLTYAVTDATGRSWIARRPPRGELLDSAHDVLREHRILAALRDTGVPVPAVVGAWDEPELADAPVVVMAHVDGLVVDTLDVARQAPARLRRAAGPSMAGALARLHDVDVDAVGLGDLASRGPYAQRQVRRWSRQWEAGRTRDLPRLDAMTELLRRTAPAPSGTVLVHGDFHLRNVILDPGDGSVRAVLDWELSTLGEPLADLGSLLAYWPEPGDEPTGLFAASAEPGFADREELVESYLAASGRSREGLGYWHALGLWKIAVIAEGVHRRAHGAGSRTDVVDRLIERAWAVAGTARLDR